MSVLVPSINAAELDRERERDDSNSSSGSSSSNDPSDPSSPSSDAASDEAIATLASASGATLGDGLSNGYNSSGANTNSSYASGGSSSATNSASNCATRSRDNSNDGSMNGSANGSATGSSYSGSVSGRSVSGRSIAESSVSTGDSGKRAMVSTHSMSLHCRMYSQSWPEVDDLVVVQVKSVVEMGAYCSLLEYNNIEGMILMSEMSRRRIRSVNKIIRVGRQEIVAVLRVNREKGYIDLSKKRVSGEEVKKVEQRWNKSKAVHSIFRHCAKKSNYSVEYLYNQIGWPITNITNPVTNKPFQHIYDGFKFLIEDEEKFIELAKWNKKIENGTISRELLSLLFTNISHRFKPQIVEIRGKIECTCFSRQGIQAIKRALKEGLLYGTDDEFVIKIRLEAPPVYNISVATLNPPKGIQRINQTIGKIKSCLTSYGGTLVTKQAPKVVDDKESNKKKKKIKPIDSHSGAK